MIHNCIKIAFRMVEMIKTQILLVLLLPHIFGTVLYTYLRHYPANCRLQQMCSKILVILHTNVNVPGLALSEQK